jgi:precorrin-6B methylase 2
MNRQLSNFNFKLIAFCFKFRDLLLPREAILKQAQIKPGFVLLDFGCGPGSYSILASEMVGPNGKVHALDANPLAIKSVLKAASKKGLKNIEVIHSDGATGLEKESVDVVILGGFNS